MWSRHLSMVRSAILIPAMRSTKQLQADRILPLRHLEMRQLSRAGWLPITLRGPSAFWGYNSTSHPVSEPNPNPPLDHARPAQELACSLNASSPGLPLLVLTVAGDLSAEVERRAAELGTLVPVEDVRFPNNMRDGRCGAHGLAHDHRCCRGEGVSQDLRRPVSRHMLAASAVLLPAVRRHTRRRCCVEDGPIVC